MKVKSRKTGKLRLLIVLGFVLIISCNKNDDDNECSDTIIDPAIVLVSIDLNDTNGQGLFENPDFNFSLFTIVTKVEPVTELPFTVRDGNGENLVIIESVPLGGINFQYDTENKTDLDITNRVIESNNCGLIIGGSFTAISNGQVVCECGFAETIPIEFDI